MNKKTLVLTGLNERLHDRFPSITGRNAEELLVMSSYGGIIAQPYGCSIRNILLAVYETGIEEIYVVGEKDSDEYEIKQEELLSKIKSTGVSEETIDIINYIDVVQHDLLNWLTGPQEAEAAILKNIEMIKRHPLIPKSVAVHGFVADSTTGDFEEVAVPENMPFKQESVPSGASLDEDALAPGQ